ncbi:MAG: 2-C-methyl-D-erythritol 2,4-cyclodiphosphate synthase [Bacteroidales bacterium]|jgi:2-C-methyl-D-erythritol 2,4-cyclodiphosphate synthase|nr:2-C-methyl-D-erythritol 2,4-cyclodiphosphate synthase [Bacteroidales bacterium]MDD2570739.1 2-C-methyl-D-erythritol 2,4-cyclodiphosphate synthase [Bacteroidales bacterium]MDD3385241.1 2-C-methyl-D-erythritol 2,4-cyclodiphosphate synthase [Bacteroidales bacterium]MDD3811419.1 2-C-methyl-D-erythritol 2,4-cyclodiphosphate synthase [Bacteroidales bacterium]MDD3871483.1 2-C-methyl-D-erythritol 2,4-cyclodiphosphate synthase [Bacteroidales bacterium]
MFRIGFGYDVHRLVEGRSLTLGGIAIPFERGTLGHSDGDVLIHAICDALLGSLALGDIGQHFPDTSPVYKDIDSKILLTRTIQLLNDRGWRVVNIDSTICLEKPKLAGRIEEMRNVLASVMGIMVEQVSIKATTSEKMGYTGTGEGVTAYAVVLVERL